MSHKVAVNNLSPNTTDERFKEVFGVHGKIAHAIIMRDRDTLASRGFGFVDYSSAEDVAATAKALDGSELDGNKIRVDKARSR